MYWEYCGYKKDVLALVCKEIVGDIKGIIMDLRWYVRRLLEISKVLLTLLSKSKRHFFISSVKKTNS